MRSFYLFINLRHKFIKERKEKTKHTYNIRDKWKRILTPQKFARLC